MPGTENVYFLGQRMRKAREASGRTLDDIARVISRDKSVLSRVENGKSSTKTTLEIAEDYCHALSLSRA